MAHCHKFHGIWPINRTGRPPSGRPTKVTYPQRIESFRCTAIFQQLVNVLEQINVSAGRLVRGKNLAISHVKRRKYRGTGNDSPQSKISLCCCRCFGPGCHCVSCPHGPYPRGPYGPGTRDDRQSHRHSPNANNNACPTARHHRMRHGPRFGLREDRDVAANVKNVLEAL